MFFYFRILLPISAKEDIGDRKDSDSILIMNLFLERMIPI